jgi:hypothetical protein
MLAWKRSSASPAPSAIAAAHGLNVAMSGHARLTGPKPHLADRRKQHMQAKPEARLAMMPTTAAVIAASAARSHSTLRSVST